jgi:hypothetical protein
MHCWDPVLVFIRDPGWNDPIRDKHPGSANLRDSFLL